jgi:CRP-like cAMP-binding protein
VNILAAVRVVCSETAQEFGRDRDAEFAKRPELPMPMPQNNLLRALRPDDFALLQPDLKPAFVRTGQVLYHPGDEVRQVYFPLEATVLGFRVVIDDGQAIETALIGREGAVSGIVSQGRLPAYCRSEVWHEGPVLRLDVERLEAAKTQSLSIRHLFARYADCLMAQIFQQVACNAAHSIEQRAAKWILSATERTPDASIPYTQEQLAGALGVGRSYLNRVMQTLKGKGLIQTRRGGLTVLDADRLHAIACRCNDAVRRHFDEVLSGVYPAESGAAAK